MWEPVTVCSTHLFIFSLKCKVWVRSQTEFPSWDKSKSADSDSPHWNVQFLLPFSWTKRPIKSAPHLQKVLHLALEIFLLQGVVFSNFQLLHLSLKLCFYFSPVDPEIFQNKGMNSLWHTQEKAGNIQSETFLPGCSFNVFELFWKFEQGCIDILRLLWWTH